MFLTTSAELKWLFCDTSGVTMWTKVRIFLMCTLARNYLQRLVCMCVSQAHNHSFRRAGGTFKARVHGSKTPIRCYKFHGKRPYRSRCEVHSLWGESHIRCCSRAAAQGDIRASRRKPFATLFSIRETD